MLKPIVVGQDTWKNQLQDARSLLTKWFPEDAEACELSDDGQLTQACQAQCADTEYAQAHNICQAAEQSAAKNDK